MTTRGWHNPSKEEFIIYINGLLPVALAPGRRPPLVAKKWGGPFPVAGSTISLAT